MAKKMSISGYTERTPKKRPGVHSKTRSSKSKRSKNYRKSYRGQGR